ncbi:COX15/CtaA family protein [Pseudonocardia nematodicida]|uniref:COX15/CtaA family protein n=1 Tax=Pseudonocardia nematodicida TaxID=1206997 RepID=A0ABV1KGD5_9PSEU
MSGLLNRVPSTPLVLMRRLAIANLIAQIGIGVTGSVVRVTGSGLGCSTWPQCEPGSMVPVAHAEIAPLHMWIEFGNRLLGVVVVLAAGICLLGALFTRPRRRRLTALALAMPLGVVAQAVIGGITVLLGLAWWTVMLHFLASMVLVWFAVLLVAAAGESDDPPGFTIPSAGRGLVLFSTAVLAALLVAGTLLTAAGPHAGDPDTPRLDADIPGLAHLHSGLLYLYLGALVGVGFLIRATAGPATLWRRYWVLVAVVLAQGVLGAVQYALGVPELLVSLHVLGAGLVTAAASWVWAGTTTRPAPLPPAPAPASVDGAAAERPLATADRS